MGEQNPAITEAQGHRNLLILLFAGFVLSGIATTIVGPMLPIFIRRWSLDDGQAGLFSSIQFLAALGGTLASSAIAASWGYRPALVMGYALMGGGLASLNADTHAVALTATAAFGLGYGLITPGTNLFVAELGGAKSASLLNQLNFAWGAGAMICSPLIALALRRNGLGILLSGTAVFGGVLVMGLLFVSFGVQKHGNDVNTAGVASAAIGLGVTIALAAMIFISWLSRWYGPAAKKIGGILFALASLGGSAGPGLIGAVSKYSGSLRVGLLVPLAGAIILIGLVLLLRRRTAA